MSNAPTPLITPQARTASARRDIPSAIVGALIAGALAGWAASWIAWHIQPQVSAHCGTIAGHVSALLKSIADVAGLGYTGFAKVYLTAMWTDGWEPLWRVGLSYYAAIVATWLSFRELSKAVEPSKHVRGRQLIKDADAEAKAKLISIEKAAVSGAEIQIHKSLTLARHQVMQSILLMAAQGGGKTQILWRIINALSAKNYKLVVFDLTKGDYTKSLSGLDRLFALGDKRSSVWAIWRDVKTLPDAESFARGLIPVSDSDPMWGSAARALLIAMLMKLTNENGENWGWRELGELAYLPLEDLKAIAVKHYPPAISAVADAESKTSQSIHINLHAFLGTLYRLYLEWSDYEPNFQNGKARAFSWIEWLDDTNSADRKIILQSNSKDKTAATSLIRAMMELQVSHMASLDYPECDSKKPETMRSIAYVLDELPQVGRLECLTTMLEVLRSRGVMCIFAFQDIAQIRQIFLQGEDDKWTAMLGIRIFGQVKGGVSQRFVLDQIGMQEIDRPSNSVTTSAGGYSVTNSYQRTETQVMSGAELELLGPQKTGIRAIVLGHGIDVLELDWDYYAPQDLRKVKVPRDATPRGLKTEIIAMAQPESNSGFTYIPPPEDVQDAVVIEEPQIELMLNDSSALAAPDDSNAHSNEKNDDAGDGVLDELADVATEHSIDESISALTGITDISGVGQAISLLEAVEGEGGDLSDGITIIATQNTQKKKRYTSRADIRNRQEEAGN